MTQAEVYARNRPQTDDCARKTLDIEYSEVPKVHLKRKEEGKNNWYEISIFWNMYEILVTGGLKGRNTSQEIEGFLRPAIPTAIRGDAEDDF